MPTCTNQLATEGRGFQRQHCDGMSALQAKMKTKLGGARFRQLNELLYTSTGEQALHTFTADPELYTIVDRWPENPLDIIISWVRRRAVSDIIADFGCGEGRLALTVPQKVHSFDLVAAHNHVTACDIAHVPLPSASVHVVILCLSLMGTNMMAYLREARRVLKDHGTVKVAEVKSRFEGQGGGIEAFLEACRSIGLEARKLDKSNKMFFLVDLIKQTSKARGKRKRGQMRPEFKAKACVYKKR